MSSKLTKLSSRKHIFAFEKKQLPLRLFFKLISLHDSDPIILNKQHTIHPISKLPKSNHIQCIFTQTAALQIMSPTLLSFQSPEIKKIYIQNETLIYLGILTKLPLENPNRTRATHIMSHQNINIDPNIIPRAQLGLLRSSSHYLLGHGHRGLHLKKKKP